MYSKRASFPGQAGLAGLVTAGLLLAGTANTADAQRRKSPALVDAKLTETIKPFRGFVDDPFEFDSAGGRLLYVNADAASLAELRVIDLTQAACS